MASRSVALTRAHLIALAGWALSGLGVSAGWGWVGAWGLAGLALLVAVGGVLGLRRGWGWAGDGAFAGLVILSAAGTFVGLPVLLALATSLAAVTAWDLSRYAQRLSATTADLGHHTRRHLRLLAGALAAGAVAALAALALRLDLGFGVALVLGVALIVLLARGVVMGLDRTGDPDLGARRE